MGSVGQSLLMKMGWKEGEGLGAQKSGPLVPVSARKRRHNKGIGSKREKKESAWWEKMMVDAYGQSNETKEEVKEDIFEACEGRRCRPHGSAKLARLAAQEGQDNTEQPATKKKKKQKKEKKRKKLGIDSKSIRKGSKSCKKVA